jgi:5-methylcytosine-specific restriction endonuclease McrA
MKKITYTDEYKQEVLDYHKTHGFMETTRKYNIPRSNICRWLRPEKYKARETARRKDGRYDKQHKEYMEKHKEKFKAYNKEYFPKWREQNREKKRKDNLKWIRENQDIIKAYRKEYNQREEVKQIRNQLFNERMENDPEYHRHRRKTRVKSNERNAEKIRQYRLKHMAPSQKWRLCWEYIKWRKEVYKRDNYICQECGRTHCRVDAHHLSRAKKDRFKVSNGITLCRECHIDKHRKHPKK